MARIEGISRGMVIFRYQTVFLECRGRAGIEALMAELSLELSQSRWNREEREIKRKVRLSLLLTRAAQPS